MSKSAKMVGTGLRPAGADLQITTKHLRGLLVQCLLLIGLHGSPVD